MASSNAPEASKHGQHHSRTYCTWLALSMLPAVVGLSPAPTSSPRLLPASVCVDGKVRYFAFGSNLLQSKMEGRGKTEVLERVPAVVTDHRLAFNMRMFPPLEPSMASIEPSMGDECEGVLYTLTRDGYEALWKSEGGSMAQPPYEEIVVNASVGAQTLPAITLRAAPRMRLKRDAPPSARYKKLIVTGANESGLSEGYIARVTSMPAASPSVALTAIARAHGVIAVLAFRLKLRKVLAPWRTACYLLLRARGHGDGMVSRLLDFVSEFATCAILLPTALMGSVIRFILRLCGREKWIQFGPPSNSTQQTNLTASNNTQQANLTASKQ